MGEAIKELMPLLQKVADKLDSSAQYLWALQLQQVYVLIVSGLIKYAIWIAFVVAGIIVIKNFYNDGLKLLNEVKLAQKEDDKTKQLKEKEFQDLKEERQKAEQELCNRMPSYRMLMSGYMSTYSHYEIERLHDARQAKEEQEKFLTIITCGWLAVSIVMYIAVLPSITELITMIANPQYYALHEIIKMVK
jgi:hypothetical protein